MRTKKTKTKAETTKRKPTGIILGVLFTIFVPIGFVFLMGILSESFPMLYHYTKQIFIGFILLLILGAAMIIYQIYRFVRAYTATPKKKERLNKKEIDAALQG